MHRSIMLTATLLALSPGSLAHAGQRSTDPKTLDEIERIQREYGVEIVYEYDARTYFPSDYFAEPISARAAQIELSEVVRLVPYIEQFLSCHPKRVIAKNLNKIYLLRDLSFYGKPYGGTVIDKCIYLPSHRDDPANTRDFIVEVLNHEFSSILLRTYSFPFVDWDRINPTGFRYWNNERELLDNPVRFAETDELRREGFLTVYSKTSLENDFNEISAKILMTPDRVNRISSFANYRRIRAKVALASKFYNSIDSGYGFDDSRPRWPGLLGASIFFCAAVAAIVWRITRTRAITPVLKD